MISELRDAPAEIEVDSICRYLSFLASQRSDRILIDTPFVACAVPIIGLRRKVTGSMFTYVDGNRRGREKTLDRLMPIVYQHLRAIASRQLAKREGAGTLSPTGLVHEAYLKLADVTDIPANDRAHFLALASVTMRHVLVDRAKARFAQKREGSLRRVSLDTEQIASADQADAVLDINDAVDRLAAIERDWLK
jgi:RNA polymerase sigma factor (TIGR02999 family)